MDSIPSAPAPTPNSSNAPKKGMSGLAIAGLGCGGLLALTLVIGGFLIMKACSKVSEVVGDFQKNPGKAAAILMVKANPDLELVKTDDATKEVTIRDKKTGEVTTISYNDVSQGKFKWKNDKGEEVTFDAANQDGKGSLVVKNKEGTTVIGGNQQSTAPPAWVPAYPGLQSTSGGMRSEKADSVIGLVSSETQDAPAKIKEFYETKLKQDGFQTETTTFNSGSGDITSVTGTKDDGKRKVTVTISTESGKTATTVVINYDGPKS